MSADLRRQLLRENPYARFHDTHVRRHDATESRECEAAASADQGPDTDRACEQADRGHVAVEAGVTQGGITTWANGRRDWLRPFRCLHTPIGVNVRIRIYLENVGKRALALLERNNA